MLEFLQETKLYIGTIFEIIAAITGIWYVKRSEKTPLEIKFFVYYLILIVFLELYGYLPIWAYLRDYEVLSFYKNSPFRRNLWWGNSLRIISTLCFSWIYIKSLSNSIIQRRFMWILIGYVLFSILSFSTFGEYFHAYDPYVNILGVSIILFSIGFYYFKLLNSDKILNFYGDLRFYISFGIVIWSLCMIPLDIYSSFFTTENPLYIKLNTIVHRYANIFLYSVFSIGFYIDYRHRLKISGKLA